MGNRFIGPFTKTRSYVIDKTKRDDLIFGLKFPFDNQPKNQSMYRDEILESYKLMPMDFKLSSPK